MTPWWRRRSAVTVTDNSGCWLTDTAEPLAALPWIALHGFVGGGDCADGTGTNGSVNQVSVDPTERLGCRFRNFNYRACKNP